MNAKDLIAYVVEGESAKELIDEMLYERWLDELLEDENLDENLRRRLHKARKKAAELTSKLKKGSVDLAQKSKEAAIETGKGFAKEGKQTARMTKTFFRLLKSKLRYREGDPVPHHRTVKAAINQLKDVGRVSAVAASFAVPIPGLLLVLELTARRFGTTIFPSALK